MAEEKAKEGLAYVVPELKKHFGFVGAYEKTVETGARLLLIHVGKQKWAQGLISPYVVFQVDRDLLTGPPEGLEETLRQAADLAKGILDASPIPDACFQGTVHFGREVAFVPVAKRA
jgi:hypothetical protein